MGSVLNVTMTSRDLHPKNRVKRSVDRKLLKGNIKGGEFLLYCLRILAEVRSRT